MKFDAKENGYSVQLTGEPFNDAYRYVDWLLTVPLLLIELILVMGLPADETASKAWSLGLASALMVCLGYPGEIQDTPSGRWLWAARASRGSPPGAGACGTPPSLSRVSSRRETCAARA